MKTKFKLYSLYALFLMTVLLHALGGVIILGKNTDKQADAVTSDKQASQPFNPPKGGAPGGKGGASRCV